MAQKAHVTSLEALETFRANLVVYLSQARPALDEVSSDPEYTPKMVETREERVNLVYPARVNIARGWDKGLLPGVSVDVRLGQAAKP